MSEKGADGGATSSQFGPVGHAFSTFHQIATLRLGTNKEEKKGYGQGGLFWHLSIGGSGGGGVGRGGGVPAACRCILSWNGSEYADVSGVQIDCPWRIVWVV